jgi:uncharacterized protein (TIGR02996 family)
VPRYEIYDADIQSFWEITLVGTSFTTRWGRVRSRGQGQVKHFATEAEARQAYDRQIALKRKKGYKLVPGTEEPEARRREAPAATIGARNPELEAAVIADPNDDAALLVLGDWLQAQGDPRGELVALQHAQRGEKDPIKFLAMKRNVEAHYATHEAALLGALHPWRHVLKLDWQIGFVRGARVSMAARREGDPDMAFVVGELARVPAAVALQELALGSLGEPDPDRGRYQDVLDLLAHTGEPRALRTLFLGDYWPGTRGEPGQLGNIEALSRFSQLRRLVVAHGTVRFGSLVLPELRSFDHRANVDAAALAWLHTQTWPKLEQLSITVHGVTPNAYIALLSPARFPAVRQLRLIDSTSTDALCDALATVPLVRQLELLDLDDGELTDDGAARLVENWGAFRHLRTLRLGKQHVTYGAAKRLRALGIDVLDPKAYRS